MYIFIHITYSQPSIHCISSGFFFVSLTASGLSTLVPPAERKFAGLNASGSWLPDISVFLASFPADRRETGTRRASCSLCIRQPGRKPTGHGGWPLLFKASQTKREREKKKRKRKLVMIIKKSGCALGKKKSGTCIAALRAATYECVFACCRRLAAQIRALCVCISACVFC